MRICRICRFANCGLTKKFACPLLAFVHFHNFRKMERWRFCRQVVADSHHCDEEHDPGPHWGEQRDPDPHESDAYPVPWSGVVVKLPRDSWVKISAEVYAGSIIDHKIMMFLSNYLIPLYTCPTAPKQKSNCSSKYYSRTILISNTYIIIQKNYNFSSDWLSFLFILLSSAGLEEAARV